MRAALCECARRLSGELVGHQSFIPGPCRPYVTEVIGRDAESCRPSWVSRRSFRQPCYDDLRNALAPRIERTAGYTRRSEDHENGLSGRPTFKNRYGR